VGLPYFIPFVMTIAMTIYSVERENDIKAWIDTGEPIFLVAMTIVSLILIAMQFRKWVKDKDVRSANQENYIYKCAYEELYSVLRSKVSFYKRIAIQKYIGDKKDTYDKKDEGDKKDTYDKKDEGDKKDTLKKILFGEEVFSNIGRISDAFLLSMASICSIPKMDINVSFIYHYTYEGAEEDDKKWRWVKGRDSNCGFTLDEIMKNENTLFHYMECNNKEMIFFNDKSELASRGHYFYSSKDRAHNCIGSILAYKICFSTNLQKCVEAIFFINTYNKRFLDEKSELDEKEFEFIINNRIFPCYKNLFKKELADLYFRHIYKDDVDDIDSCGKK
jgi:hypothetical protein